MKFTVDFMAEDRQSGITGEFEAPDREAAIEAAREKWNVAADSTEWPIQEAAAAAAV